MKRKIAWLALPLVLCALILGVKWRAEHPTPTPQDWQIRSQMAVSPLVQVFRLGQGSAKNTYQQRLSASETESLVNCFFMSPYRDQLNYSSIGPSNELMINLKFVTSKRKSLEKLRVEIKVETRSGKVTVGFPNAVSYSLHPVTVKRWIELLLANPRIGPELRARMK